VIPSQFGHHISLFITFYSSQTHIHLDTCFVRPYWPPRTPLYTFFCPNIVHRYTAFEWTLSPSSGQH